MPVLLHDAAAPGADDQVCTRCGAVLATFPDDGTPVAFPVGDVTDYEEGFIRGAKVLMAGNDPDAELCV